MYFFLLPQSFYAINLANKCRNIFTGNTLKKERKKDVLQSEQNCKLKLSSEKL